MKGNRIVLLLMSILLCFGHVVHSQTSVYDSLMLNIRKAQWSEIDNLTSLEASVATAVRIVQPDGYWTDIDYSSTSQTSWRPAGHLERLKNIALLVSNESSKYYNDDTICQKVTRALKYWYDKDPRSTNWYNQQIRCPKYVGEILILMRGTIFPVRKTLEDSLLARMVSIGGSPSNQYAVGGSSNKINIACHYIYRGCLTQSANTLKVGVDSCLSPVKINPPSLGLQFDYSYQEHENQLYVGNYGSEFINNISIIAQYLVNTRYAMAGDKLDIMSRYARNIFTRSTRGNYSSFSIPGRQVANRNKLFTPNQDIFKRMKILDANYALVYDTTIQRLNGSQPPSYGINSDHSHYWISDYTTHIRPGYSFDVRMVSTRTVRTENVNDENLKGHLLSDGATNIVVDGDEYYNIFPTWDWAHIPGTTAPHFTSIPNLPRSQYFKGESAFVGGVSDTLYGASVYDMNSSKFKTKAKKAWFFFEDEVVCLGAGISSTDALEINTTVNQTLRKGTVTYNDGAQKDLDPGATQVFNGNLKWAWHNKIGYVFPDAQNIEMSNIEQSGNWYDIAVSQANATVTSDVVSLWINNGVKPTASKYSYIVVPNISSAKEVDDYSNAGNIEIARNDDTIQSVYNKKMGLWQTVVYKGMEKLKTDSFVFWSDNPCIVMFKREGNGKITGHVSDPTRTLSQLLLYYQKDTSSATRPRNISIKLPSGDMAGLSVPFTIDDNSPSYSLSTTTINVSEDTYVNQGQTTATPKLNYGAASVLFVKKNSDTKVNNREVYLKFLVDKYNIDASQIRSAKLRLFLKDADGSNTIAYNWIVKLLTNDSWKEGAGNDAGVENTSTDPAAGMTYENTRTIAGSTGNTIAQSPWTTRANTPVEFDITAAVVDQFAGDKTISLMLFGDVGGNKTSANFHSKENGNEAYIPQLVIEHLTDNAIVLPVKLLHFNGFVQSDKIKLQWATASEYNNSKFVIQRKSKNNSFDNIGGVSGNNRPSSYVFHDDKPSPGTNQYRLQQVDLDGKQTHSQIISLTWNNYAFKIQPNPVLNEIVIATPNPLNQKTTFAIIDLNGRKLLEWTTSGKENVVSQNVHHLTPGLYFLHVTGENMAKASYKFIKK